MVAVNVETAEREAVAMLDTVWGLISGDPRLIPVDPIQIAHQLGISVYVGELDSSVSGELVKHSGRDPEIRINRNDHTNRARFTCAHELGHYVLHQGDEEFEYVDYRGPLASSGLRPEERFANRFAAALLMPANEVRRRFEDVPSITTLAWQFRVSADAMRFRLITLELISG